MRLVEHRLDEPRSCAYRLASRRNRVLLGVCPGL